MLNSILPLPPIYDSMWPEFDLNLLKKQQSQNSENKSDFIQPNNENLKNQKEKLNVLDRNSKNEGRN
jgi:hypothetical protein